MNRIVTFLILLSALLSAGEKSVVLESREVLTIHSIDRAEYRVYRKLLIADESGKAFARLSLDVSDYVDLKSVSVRLFNKQGKQKGRYKKKHFSEYKNSGNGIIGSDDSALRLNLESKLPLPFTMEVENTYVLSSLFFWPDWVPQSTIPVRTASYELIVPPGYGFNRFSPSGMEPEQLAENHFIWTLSDLEPLPDEISMPAEVEDRYRLFFTADSFTLDGYSGSLKSWESFATFYQELAQGQYVLDVNSLQGFDISSASTLRDTIAQIYDYVQRSTRYVGMELGIHGWKPHSSDWVCQNKYGDCKDLATYFIALLRKFNIEAYPVLILTRDRGVTYPQFPNNRFNHAIACLPMYGDTLWIDCTLDNSGIDVIPDRDQGCVVVIAGGEGPVLSRTPINLPENNSTHFKAEMELHDDGSASIKGQYTLDCQAGMWARYRFLVDTEKEQRESVINLFRGTAPGLELGTYSISNLDDKYAPMIITFEASIPYLATRSGKRLFVNLAMPKKAGWNGEHPSRRTMPFFAGIPSLYSSEIDLHYSGQLKLETLPIEVDIENEFGSFRQTSTTGINSIHYSWQKIEKQILIGIEEYPAYYKFRLNVKQAHDSRLVFTQE